MIKKITTIIITIGTTLCFTNASVNGYVKNIGTSESEYDNTYTINVNGASFVKTTYLKTTKNILMYSEGNYFFWLNTGLPYIHGQSMYGASNEGQGNPTNYLLCDNITDTPTNCTNKDYLTNTEDLKQIIGNINKYFYGKFIQSNEVGEGYQGPIFCFSSDELGKSACFYACRHPNCGSSTTDTIGGVRAYSNLTNSQNFGKSLSSIPNDKIGIYNGYTKPTQRNNNQICPSLGQILNNYDKNYNTGLCYNNTIIYNSGQIETVDKRNIQQIFTGYEELNNRRSIYNNNCKAIFTKETCMNAFSGNLDKYAIISNGVNQNAEPKRVRNYCNIYLNYDLNMSSCVASGRQGVTFTPEEITNTILSLDNLTVQTPKTGNILNGLLDEGEERANPLDILGNIEQIKDKFTILFEERKGINGIIPPYIIWIMLLTILLTVLFKK